MQSVSLNSCGRDDIVSRASSRKTTSSDFCVRAPVCLVFCVSYVPELMVFNFNSSQNTEVAYILYNDQRPPVDYGDRWVENGGNRGGHTKGEDQVKLQYLHIPDKLQEI